MIHRWQSSPRLAAALWLLVLALLFGFHADAAPLCDFGAMQWAQAYTVAAGGWVLDPVAHELTDVEHATLVALPDGDTPLYGNGRWNVPDDTHATALSVYTSARGEQRWLLTWHSEATGQTFVVGFYDLTADGHPLGNHKICMATEVG